MKNSRKSQKAGATSKGGVLAEIAVLLPDIRSAYNIGSIFRTCDAAGVRKIYLAGHSPCPTDRFGRVRKDIAKTALGAEQSVAWEYCKNASTLLKILKAEEFFVVAVEQSGSSINYLNKGILKEKRKVVFIFGNEVGGLPKSILNLADVSVEIPMKGKKESLNVSVAAGVVLFGMMR